MSGEHRRRRYWLGGKREAAQDQFFVEALDPALWEPGDENDWDACWYTGMPAPEVFEQLTPGKTVNHIPGNNALTVKSLLYRTLREARERWEGQGGIAGESAGRLAFFPRTFAMPADYHALQHEAARRPSQRWILKPKNAARGKDIRVLDDVARVPIGDRWMVQDYVGNPHTLEGCKYALRLYVLITSVEPLRVYLYREGSAKLASEPYEPDNIENVYAHLTNPDVNARNAAAAAPVRFLPLADYRERLRAQGHDDVALFERLHDLVTLTAIAAREAMRRRCRQVQADTRGCYELLGLDCLVDSDLNPWLMECNLSPSLDICAAPEDGGISETRTKRQMVADLVAMLGLNDADPVPPLAAETADPEAELARQAEVELARAGDFMRLYPSPQAERYLPCFPLPRLVDVAVADAVAGAPVPRPRVVPRQATEIIGEDGLALYGERRGSLFRPNPTAAWIWLQATDGKDPDTVARELASASGQGSGDGAPWALREEVWTALADWAQAGLLWQHTGAATEPEAGPAAAGEQQNRATPGELVLRIGERRIVLADVPAPVQPRIEAALGPLRVGEGRPDRCLHLTETAGGYAVLEDGRAVAEGLSLAAVVPGLCRLLLARSGARDGDLLLDVPVVGLGDSGEGGESAALVTGGEPGAADALAVALARRLGTGCGRGLRLEPQDPDSARALGLPLQLRKADAEALGVHDGRWHQWSRRHGGALAPSAGPAAEAAQGIGEVILLEASAPSEGVAADVGGVLAALLPGSLVARGGHLQTGDVDALAEWLQQRALRAVRAAEPTAVAGRLPIRQAEREGGGQVLT